MVSTTSRSRQLMPPFPRIWCGYREGMTKSPTLDQVTRYHDALPMRIRDYLNRRGITDAVIDLHLLGWNGDRITIPVFDHEGHLAFFKLTKNPDDMRDSPKMITPAGASAELYGWERVRTKPCRIVICEGEFDRLVLETRGFAAVTSTGGAGVFRSEWAEAFREIPEVFLCFDRDEAGHRGAFRVAQAISHARIIDLPEEVGAGGDVTDFFVRLRHTREDFEKLLAAARPAEVPKPEWLKVPGTRRLPNRGDEISRLKASVSIETVVARYVPLRPSGKSLVGRCPFHQDLKPSFTVYPEKGIFHCYGCSAHGDVIEFLMRAEHLTFQEALKVARELAHEDGRQDQATG